ncbi:MAG: DUF3276 family protein [Bacteroidales bacterium]
MSEQEQQKKHREDAFSKVVRAGKRTYFFDVKQSRNGEYFLTLTESKRIFQSEGKFTYEKHKIFLYPEDFEKFNDGFQTALNFIKENSPELQDSKNNTESFSDVNFDDLESK